MQRALRRFAVCLLTIVFIAGCAVPTGVSVSDQSERSVWRGRLAVRVESDRAESQAQAVAAGFELSGNAQTGELTLYTPLGTTAAALSWSDQTALMRTNGDVRSFASLDALIEQAVGTQIPVKALFAWLGGDNMRAAGWNADLSQLAQGRLTARRTDPPPITELRLVLEK